MSLDYGGLPGQLRVDALGMERCAPGHRYGPAAREYTLIHCVFSGKGEFFADGKRYALGAGQGFLICPRMLASYRADEQDPWTYGWMGYSGALAAGLTARAGLRREAPVFPVGEAAPLVEILRRAQEEMAGLRLGELGAAGGLLRFLAHYLVGALVWGKYMPDEFFGMSMTSPWFYSLLYNGSYMLPDIILCAVVFALLYRPLKKYFTGADLIAA